ncbi:serine hydrolase domain-containing protein [Microbulbifer agarilyticus]
MISFLFCSLVSAGAGLSVPPSAPVPLEPVSKYEELRKFIGGVGESGEYQEIHSLLVYHYGRMVGEKYFFGNADYIDFSDGVKRISVPDRKQWLESDPHYVASINKSITALVTGIWLEEQGRDVSQALAPLLPRYKNYFSDPQKSEISVHHVLSMQAGFLWDEWDSDDLINLWKSKDFATYLLEKENYGPGKEWRYNSAVLNLLYEAIQGTLSEPLDQWAEQRLYRPLGITNFYWDVQPNGIAEASARLSLLPRDMMKLGVLILQRGQWEGEQIVPSLWIQQMCSIQAKGSAGSYGYGIWPRKLSGYSVCTAEGDGGQYIYVIEEKELVVVMTQGNYLQWPLYRHQSENILFRLLELLDSPKPDF